jgi:uncharacterized RDD family membrane protein YckC
LSSSNNQAQLAPSWKQEVNRRLAAHRSRNGPSIVAPAQTDAQRANSPGAAAAARVAARFAKAPSYSEMLAEEARAAVRAAEAATHAAQKAQAAAESVLIGIEAGMQSASVNEPLWEPEPIHAAPPVEFEERAAESVQWTMPSSHEPMDRPVESASLESSPVAIFSSRLVQPQAALAVEQAVPIQAVEENWQEMDAPSMDDDDFEFDGRYPAESAPAFHANLIEFPRELVATRKARPRLAEGPLAPPVGQLSIFEVDPGSISTEPAAALAGVEAAPAWQQSVWSGVELDAQPEEETETEALAAEEASNRELAPLSLHSMAVLVDGALIVAAFLAVAMTVAAGFDNLPSMRATEVAAAALLLGVGVIYHALFFWLAGATPGMRYAGISLCTFDDQMPTREQLRSRIGAMLLSLLPVGLGVLWAIFDEEHLSWHDRISHTYLRRG